MERSPSDFRRKFKKPEEVVPDRKLSPDASTPVDDADLDFDSYEKDIDFRFDPRAGRKMWNIDDVHYGTDVQWRAEGMGAEIMNEETVLKGPDDYPADQLRSWMIKDAQTQVGNQIGEDRPNYLQLHDAIRHRDAHVRWLFSDSELRKMDGLTAEEFVRAVKDRMVDIEQDPLAHQNRRHIEIDAKPLKSPTGTTDLWLAAARRHGALAVEFEHLVEEIEEDLRKEGLTARQVEEIKHDRVVDFDFREGFDMHDVNSPESLMGILHYPIEQRRAWLKKETEQKLGMKDAWSVVELDDELKVIDQEKRSVLNLLFRSDRMREVEDRLFKLPSAELLRVAEEEVRAQNKNLEKTNRRYNWQLYGQLRELEELNQELNQEKLQEAEVYGEE